MKEKMNAALRLTLIALLSLTLNYGAFADQPPDNVQGNWTIYSTSIKNGETVVKHVKLHSTATASPDTLKVLTSRDRFKVRSTDTTSDLIR